MATPVDTTIEDAIKAVLDGITVANGYEVTLTVERVGSVTNVPADLKVVLSRGAMHDITDDDAQQQKYPVPLMRDGYLMPVYMTLFRAQATTDSDTAFAKATAAIRKAIKANYTFGDRVQNIYWKPETVVSVGGVIAVDPIMDC